MSETNGLDSGCRKEWYGEPLKNILVLGSHAQMLIAIKNNLKKKQFIQIK